MVQQSGPAFLIVFGFIGMVFLGMLISIIVSIAKRRDLENENERRMIESKQQIELFKAVADAEEKQKGNLASNLHDQILPVLALASRNINSRITDLEKNGVEVENLKEDVEYLASVSDDLREIAYGLVPRLFKTFGFTKSIESYIKQLNEFEDLTVDFEYEREIKIAIPETDQLIIYRICLEILNNLQKHSKCDYLRVSLITTEKMLNIMFVHNGVSVNNDQIEEYRKNSPGIGLNSLQSRSIILGATIDYYSEIELSCVKLSVPIK